MYKLQNTGKLVARALFNESEMLFNRLSQLYCLFALILLDWIKCMFQEGKRAKCVNLKRYLDFSISIPSKGLLKIVKYFIVF